ncbi:transporter substrate-binding domain-containing protein, partial [Brevundimonas sp.]
MQIIRSELAPLGRLRVAINLGNPVLAQRAADGALAGVSVDLAWEIAVRLGVEMELSNFATAGAAVAALQD